MSYREKLVRESVTNSYALGYIQGEGYCVFVKGRQVVTGAADEQDAIDRMNPWPVEQTKAQEDLDAYNYEQEAEDYASLAIVTDRPPAW